MCEREKEKERERERKRERKRGAEREKEREDRLVSACPPIAIHFRLIVHNTTMYLAARTRSSRCLSRL